MAHVNITISTEAYEKLKALKREGESFSKAVLRLAGKPALSDVVGILSGQEADELEKGVARGRKTFKVRTWQ